MSNSHSDSYAAAGVDITAGYRAVELMKSHIARTMTAGVCSDVGGFGGLFELDVTGMEKPVLVSGTAGVGTKLKLAFLMDKHDTVGIDCVAMCVNDIICCGAKPLFFLDYIACGKNVPERIAQIVAGVAEGCVQSGAALIGGEPAEMPGFYPADEYDLAGFSVGVVDKKAIIDNSSMAKGDVVIALPSSGVHSNGFSLVRKVFDVENKDIKTPLESLGGKSIGETLLTPTMIYVKPMLALFQAVTVKGVSHITGGGTNLQALIDAEKNGLLPSGHICLVVSNKAEAYALERARQAGIPAVTLLRKDCDGQAGFEAALLQLLAQEQIDLIILAGFMSILSEDFTRRFPERILNVHPSLIPSFCGKGFYGLHVHEAALAYGVKVTGATVHFVNEIPDGGRILLQQAVSVLPGDTPETLQRRVMEQAEWKLLPQAAEMVAAEIIKGRAE